MRANSAVGRVEPVHTPHTVAFTHITQGSACLDNPGGIKSKQESAVQKGGKKKKGKFPRSLRSAYMALYASCT